MGGGQAFVFDDVISPEANTNAVFHTLLNFSDYENKEMPWFYQMNLLDIMRLAGYHTMWLSNQGKFSIFGNIPATLSDRADIQRYTDITNTAPQTYDGKLLDLYDKNKHFLGDKNFIIFHLIGSHLRYSGRFPKSYAKFHPADINPKGLHIKSQKDLQIVSDYVNTFYYTDDVLAKIFERFQDSDSIVFYLSDHAQDVFQTKHSAGHQCSDFGVEIPFIIYVSKTFMAKHKDKVEEIKSALKKPFMTDDFIQSLLPLIGITTKDNIEAKNIFSPQFDSKRKRFYCGTKEYKGR
ncbi:hypothetical protein BJI48_00705 [Helicobacter sp. 11S02596-1]|nr:hypothetical protein BJI48_00705 [Helicobacter sp. 11S02596-1]